MQRAGQAVAPPNRLRGPGRSWGCSLWPSSASAGVPRARAFAMSCKGLGQPPKRVQACPGRGLAA
eukprot:695869-Lingulodinium_polyedra.AAC.1